MISGSLVISQKIYNFAHRVRTVVGFAAKRP